MALSTAFFPLSLPAAADYSTKQYFAVVATGGVATLAGAAVKILGVLQDKPDTAGKACTVEVYGRTKGVVGAAVVAGVELEVDASAKFITLAAGVSVGYALSAGAADGDLIDLVLK